MVEKETVIENLKKVMDPELGYDVWNLGLIYDIKIEEKKVTINMTFTTPMCPYGPQLMDEIRRTISVIEGVGEVGIELTFTPPWNQDRMSEEARIALGI